MLRSGKNWKKLTEDQDMYTTLPPELAAIKNTIDTIPTEWMNCSAGETGPEQLRTHNHNFLQDTACARCLTVVIYAEKSL